MWYTGGPLPLPAQTFMTVHSPVHRGLHLMDLLDEEMQASIPAAPELEQTLSQLCEASDLYPAPEHVTRAVERYLATETSSTPAIPASPDDLYAVSPFQTWKRPVSQSQIDHIFEQEKAWIQHEEKLVNQIQSRPDDVFKRFLQVGILMGIGAAAWLTHAFHHVDLGLFCGALIFASVTFSGAFLSEPIGEFSKKTAKLREELKIVQGHRKQLRDHWHLDDLKPYFPSSKEQKAWMKCPETLSLLQALTTESVPLLERDADELNERAKDWKMQLKWARQDKKEEKIGAQWEELFRNSVLSFKS
jgi:hypothetical protein